MIGMIATDLAGVVDAAAALDAPSEAAPIVWTEIGWAVIQEPEHRNTDLIPARCDRLLTDGCPECKAAWVELLAIGFTMPRAPGVIRWNGRGFDVATRAVFPLDQRAVRVQCFSGHYFEFDAVTGLSRRHTPMPAWAILGVGAMAIYGWYATRALGMPQKG